MGLVPQVALYPFGDQYIDQMLTISSMTDGMQSELHNSGYKSFAIPRLPSD